jgi:hypothetical protein
VNGVTHDAACDDVHRTRVLINRRGITINTAPGRGWEIGLSGGLYVVSGVMHEMCSHHVRSQHARTSKPSRDHITGATSYRFQMTP